MSEWADSVNAKLGILQQALRDRDAKIKTLDHLANLVADLINSGQLVLQVRNLEEAKKQVALHQAILVCGEMWEQELAKRNGSK